MTTVYVIIYKDYSATDVECVFDNREQAERFAQRGDYQIEETELNPDFDDYFAHKWLVHSTLRGPVQVDGPFLKACRPVDHQLRYEESRVGELGMYLLAQNRSEAEAQYAAVRAAFLAGDLVAQQWTARGLQHLKHIDGEIRVVDQPESPAGGSSGGSKFSTSIERS